MRRALVFSQFTFADLLLLAMRRAHQRRREIQSDQDLAAAHGQGERAISRPLNAAFLDPLADSLRSLEIDLDKLISSVTDLTTLDLPCRAELMPSLATLIQLTQQGNKQTDVRAPSLVTFYLSL